MRRIYTNKAVLLIAGMLLASALAFAWLRSRPAPVRAEAAAPPPAAEVTGRLAFDWRAIGAQTYQANCASCHSDGRGTRHVPPLSGHAVDMFQAEGGRAYLVDFLLYGLERHPAYADRLSDNQAAAVLNHMLTAWGNSDLLATNRRLYGPPEVAEHRLQMLTPAQMKARRPEMPGDSEK